jgi:deoxyribodipyrimidine photo-lyase
MIEPQRIRQLNSHPIVDGQFVLYWMQASQRTRFNPALEHAIALANEQRKPLLVCFGLMDNYPEANERHYAFMLEGLKDVHTRLAKRRIKFVVKHGQPADVALHFSRRASMVICDRGYQRHQKRWRDTVADGAGCRVVQVEGDVVVPVETASDHCEFAARTLRPKIHKHWERFLKKPRSLAVKLSSLNLDVSGDIDVTDTESTLARLKIDRSVPRSTRFVGGEKAAGKRLREFLNHKLNDYANRRNEPSVQATSTMSAYLHFGQISPIELALAVRGRQLSFADSRESYLEELIVRRELAVNFVEYHPKYDSYDALPRWAQKTLAEHRRDKRAYVYTREQLENAATHDRYWNTAQLEMTRTGYMHNYMRMYWGKKILEWKRSPREAYSDVLYLNNKYFLCGRDPNAYANVGWIFGLHDRPWGPARKIFGTVRYMNAAGLERKFDMEGYLNFILSEARTRAQSKDMAGR